MNENPFEYNPKAECFDFFVEHPELAIKFCDAVDSIQIYNVYQDYEDEPGVSEYVGSLCPDEIGEVAEKWYVTVSDPWFDNEPLFEGNLGITEVIFEDPDEECCCKKDENPDPRFAEWERKYKFERP